MQPLPTLHVVRESGIGIYRCWGTGIYNSATGPCDLGLLRGYQRELRELGGKKEPLRERKKKKDFGGMPIADSGHSFIYFFLSFICSINIHFMPTMFLVLCEIAAGKRFVDDFTKQPTVCQALC